MENRGAVQAIQRVRGIGYESPGAIRGYDALEDGGGSVRRHRHLGAYGVAVADGCVLLIRKAQGPYKGAWDLPGGGIEFGESPEDTVRRELMEETNVSVQRLELLAVYHKRLTYTLPGGEQEDLEHIGIIYRVEVDRTVSLRTEPDGIDSLGAQWVRLDQLEGERLSPFAARALGLPDRW